jgi:hypothetical protein
MGELLKFKKPKLSEKYKGRTLCHSGLHKWKVEKESRFDVKEGKLVTMLRCSRCGKTKVKAT